MSEMSLNLTTSPEIDLLIAQIKDIETKLGNNQKMLTRKTDFVFCPICQDGYLISKDRGRILGVIADKWLVCSKCNAEFDKKLEKAALVKVSKDPYGIYKKYANQTLPLEKWKEIAFSRIRAENYNYEEKLSLIKAKIKQFILQQFLESKLKLLLIDLKSFIFKKDEIPVFATKAEVIEERKRKVTQRTTTGGGRRNYGGFTFRVAKGLYYHAGSSAPASPRQTTIQSTEYSELVAADNGDFLITNQRILFKGNRSRGLVIPINKIVAIDIDPDENVLMIVQENKKPSILKLQTTFTSYISGIEVPFSITLDNVIDIVRPLKEEG
jgi:hypothetical protein